MHHIKHKLFLLLLLFFVNALPKGTVHSNLICIRQKDTYDFSLSLSAAATFCSRLLWNIDFICSIDHKQLAQTQSVPEERAAGVSEVGRAEGAQRLTLSANKARYRGRKCAVRFDSQTVSNTFFFTLRHNRITFFFLFYFLLSILLVLCPTVKTNILKVHCVVVGNTLT